MRRLSRLTRQPFRQATSLVLGSTPATRFEATKLDEKRALAVRGSFLAGSTPRCFRMKLIRLAAPTRLCVGTAIWFGLALSRIARIANRNAFTREAVLGAINFCLPGGTYCSVNDTCGPRCRLCAAVRSIALFARCGARTVRNLVSVASRL